jgi:outer membrane protein assembly factor BamB
MVFVSGYIINADAVREDATVAYSAATGATLWVRKYRDAQAPTAVVLSPDGSTLFVETGDYRTLAYNATTGHQRWVSSVTGLRKDSSATALAASPDGLRLFVTGQSANNGRPWTYQTAAYDAATGTLLWAAHPRPLAPNGATGESLAVSPDGSTLYTAGFVPAAPGGAVIAYRSATGATLWRDNDLAGNLFRLALSPDGSTLVAFGYINGAPPTSGYDTRALNAATGGSLWSRVHAFTPGTAATAIAMSPDGATVFVTGTVPAGPGYVFDTLAYTTVTGARLWEARYFAPAKTHGEVVPNAIVVSPDGSRVFVTGDAPNASNNLSFATVAYRT